MYEFPASKTIIYESRELTKPPLEYQSGGDVRESVTPSKLFKPAPSSEQIEALKAAAESARAKHQVEADRLRAIEAQLAKFREDLKERPDLDEALSVATVVDIKVRAGLVSSPTAKKAAEQLAAARDAVDEAAKRRREAEAVVRDIEALVAEQKRKTDPLLAAMDVAESRLGEAMALRVIAEEYLPHLSAALGALRKADSFWRLSVYALKVSGLEVDSWFSPGDMALDSDATAEGVEAELAADGSAPA